MAKMYLSPAAHEHDRTCKAKNGCSENTHVNLYVDQLIPYLNACGIAWKRSDKKNKGSLYSVTIRESNAFSPDIHYAVHTNGYDGTVKGNRIGCYYKDTKSRRFAETLSAWRKKLYPYGSKVRDYSDLGEVQGTTAICLYEELVFHDNAEDAAWLHDHLRSMARNAAQAFCELLGVTFVDPYAAKAGDVNGDGRVDTADLVKAARAVAGIEPLSDKEKAAADVTGDKTVNSADLVKIARTVAGS